MPDFQMIGLANAGCFFTGGWERKRWCDKFDVFKWAERGIKEATNYKESDWTMTEHVFVGGHIGESMGGK